MERCEYCKHYGWGTGHCTCGGVSESYAGSSRIGSDRPGAAQTEVRIGHVGLARRTPDFHATSVMNAILGGHIDLTDSNLTQKGKVEAGQLKFLAIGTEKGVVYVLKSEA